MAASKILLHLLLAAYIFAFFTTSAAIFTDSSLPAIVHQTRVPVCGEFCNFNLCIFNGSLLVRPTAAFTVFSGPGATQRPFICSNDGTVGRISKTAEARVFLTTGTRTRYVPISKWVPAGLRPKYSKNFIKAFRIPSPRAGGRDRLPHSTIGNANPRGNQWDFLHHQCMILPIRAYQKVNTAFRPVGNVLTRGRKACVAFRTTAPDIHVELTWDSNDGFDLDLTEPDGDFINRTNSRTEAGKVNEDTSFSYCPTGSTQGKENIVYFPGGPIESGTYTLKVIHFESCVGKNSAWKLRVLFNGIVQSVYTGFSSTGNKTLLKTITFTYP